MSKSENDALKETLNGMLARYKSDVNLLRGPKLIPNATAQELPFTFIKRLSAATSELEKACAELQEAISNL